MMTIFSSRSPSPLPRLPWTLTSLLMLAMFIMIGCAAPQRPDGGRGLLPVGRSVPHLEGVDQNGVRHQLSDYKGSPVVVYFYPKDGTPGCTKEACAFRDTWKKFTAAHLQVFGVSSDNLESHQNFAKKESIPFPLISDTNHDWQQVFGVSSSFGIYSRVTFLLDTEGKVAKVYPNVDPAIHAATVLHDAADLTPKSKAGTKK
jgi:thioredoxin-dependent peroxiredoxin